MSNSKLFVALILTVGFASLSSATDYYVSPSGNDMANNGTSSSTPWKTIAKVNGRSFAAGDRILFQGGQTFAGNLYLSTNTSGTASTPVVVSSYGTGRASINGGASYGAYVYNVGGIKFDNLRVYGGWNGTTQTGNSSGGIFFYTNRTGGVKLSGVTVNNCEVSGFKSGGVIFGSGPSDNSQSGYKDVVVSNTLSHDNGEAGVTTWGPTPTVGSTAYAHTNVTISWTKACNNLGVQNIGHHSGEGIVLGDANGGTIEHCVAYGNGSKSNATAGGPVGIWVWDTNAVTIQYCESHHNSTGAGTPDGDGFDLDGGATNCVMQYNYSHDNHGAGYLLYEYGDPRGNNKNNTVRFNVSQNDAAGNASYAGIWLLNNCTGNRIYNNTVYNVNRLPVYVGGGSDNWFVNNIFYSNASGNYAAYIENANCWFFNNDYWGGSYGVRIYYFGTTYTTLAGFQGAGQEKLNGVAYGKAVNPGLQSAGGGGNVDTGTPSAMTNYKLVSGSLLLSQGYNMTSLGVNMGSIDFYLLTIPPIHIGAY